MTARLLEQMYRLTMSNCSVHDRQECICLHSLGVLAFVNGATAKRKMDDSYE